MKEQNTTGFLFCIIIYNSCEGENPFNEFYFVWGGSLPSNFDLRENLSGLFGKRAKLARYRNESVRKRKEKSQ